MSYLLRQTIGLRDFWFRNYVLSFFEQSFELKILGGYTGTGKTEILHNLEHKGQQIIDLEGLANHRGSAFGGIDLEPQPTTEQFENQLFSKLQSLNPNFPIWIEDESLYRQLLTFEL